MATYVILSKIAHGAYCEPKEFKKLAVMVSEKIHKECPGVTWKASYAAMGRFDVIDVVECDNPADIERAAMIIRAYGNATTETMTATPWKEFLARL